MVQSAVPRSAVANSLFSDLQALPASSRLSDAQLEVIYALAYTHVTQGQYAQAMPIFAMLATYGSTRKHYIAGLALCLQHCGRCEEAIITYSFLITLYPDSLEAAVQSAECQLSLGRPDEAAEQLRCVLRSIGELGEGHDAVAQRARVLLGLAGQSDS